MAHHFNPRFDYIYFEAFRIIGQRFPILWQPGHDDRSRIYMKRDAYEEVLIAIRQVFPVPVFITGK